MMMYNRILVPLDGSQKADKALDVALEVSKNFGCEIQLLSIVHHIHNDADSLSSKLYEGLSTNAHKIIEAARDRAWNKGLTIKGYVRDGNPKKEICEFAKENDADLIIMGKSGANAFDRLVLGSTTAYVIRNADTQVLVVNA